MPDARAKLLEEITRLEDRHYTYYPKDDFPALLDAALEQARREQREKTALLCDEYARRSLSEPAAYLMKELAAILRGAPEETAAAKVRDLCAQAGITPREFAERMDALTPEQIAKARGGEEG